MKPTLNINLAGYPFTIDDDAYRLLKDYLDTIRYAFDTKEDTEDLATDIESRIAEILIEKEEGGVRIVTIEEISKVIERIGKPSQFIEIDEENIEIHKDRPSPENEQVVTPPPYDPSKYSRNPFVRKRIFRDPQNAMIGGVCAGIAQYLHIDVTIVRLITILLFFLSASTVAIVYIILWIVVPEAHTPIQRMQMMGEDTTIENIGKTVTGNYQENGNRENSSEYKSGVAGFLSTVLSIFIKILIFLGILIAVPLLIALSAGLIGCIIAVFIIGIAIFGGITEGAYGWFDSTLEGQFVFFILLAVIGGIITLGIPLWLLFRMLWNKKDNSRPPHYNPANQRIMLIVWLCGIALLSVFTVKAVKKGHQIDSLEWGVNLENINELNQIDTEEIENVNIKKSGIIIESKDGRKFEIANGKVNKEISQNDTLDVATISESAGDSTLIITSSSIEIADTIK